MASQSNSVLTTFIIIAVLVFAAAVGWKIFGSEDSTETAATETTEVAASEQNTNTPKPMATTPQTNNEQPAVEPEPFMPLTEEDKQERMEQARKSMKFAMRFKNAEEAIDALRRYHDNGNPELASSLLRYIQDTYPNTAIPADLVDL